MSFEWNLFRNIFSQWQQIVEQLAITIRHQAMEIQKTKIAINLLNASSVQEVNMTEGL